MFTGLGPERLIFPLAEVEADFVFAVDKKGSAVRFLQQQSHLKPYHCNFNAECVRAVLLTQVCLDHFGRDADAHFPSQFLIVAMASLVAYAAGVSNDATPLGASIFFYARVAHAIVYAFGWPMIRPLIYFVSLYGTVVILLQILKGV